MSVAPESRVLSAQQIADFAKAAGFTGDALKIAVAVAFAESSGNPSARNPKTGVDRLGSYYRGLWQISTVHKQYSDATCYDPLGNAKAAYNISGGGTNWKPWEAYTNGAYKQYLAKAGAAADLSIAVGGSAGSLTNVVGDINYPVPPPSRLDPAPLPPKDPNSIVILGRALEEQVGRAWVSGSVDMTGDGIPSISLSFVDQEFAIWGAAWNTQGTPVDWDGWRLELAGKSCDERGEVNYTTLEFWPRGIASLKQRQGASRRSLSAGQWIEAEAGISGLQVINYEARGLSRDTIGPDTTESSGIGIVPTTQTGKQPETAWDTMGRLASEDGCVVFALPEGKLVYGKPTIFVRAFSYLDAGFRGSAAGDPALNFTRIKPDVVVDSAKATVNKRATVWLPRSRGERVRPGMACRLPGFPSFDDGAYLVKKVGWELGEINDDVQIEIERPVDPVPQGERDEAGLGDPSVASSVSGAPGDLKKGTKSAYDFVAWAQKQVNDKYVFGANPSASDPDPSQFDCSSLVKWAAAQVGLNMPRTSNEQLAVCTPISVEEASRTRGALIFVKGTGANGHVVISLGTGNHTIEARGQKYGVVNYRISGRGFDAAGKIKGLYYGDPKDSVSTLDLLSPKNDSVSTLTLINGAGGSW